MGSSGGNRTRGGPSVLCGRDFAVTAVFSASKHVSPPWQPSKGRMNSPWFLSFPAHLLPCPLGTQLDAPAPPISPLCLATFPPWAVALAISCRGSRGLAQNLLISCPTGSRLALGGRVGYACHRSGWASASPPMWDNQPGASPTFCGLNLIFARRAQSV